MIDKVSENAGREPIALVGIGCRFPGGATSPEAFWQLLAEGRDAITEVPADRWSLKDFYDPDPAKSGKMYSRFGGFVENFDQLDASFFGISPREAEVMDPQQRWLLEVTWEAFEDAGEPVERWAGSSAGVFIGFSAQDYSTLQGTPSERRIRSAYRLLGTVTCIAANRISYFFNLRGPSLTVDTACSSSLTALHLACQSLWSGETSLAVTGGVSVILKPEPHIGFCNASMLSPDGRCKAFDARADGYVRAEGAAAVLLKPLSAALRDENEIYAVILSTAANQDGHTASITIPNGDAQERMLRSALRQANVKPADVQYVEAHGTGTAVGDPIEARSIGRVLSEGREAGSCCVIGSVKTNIGHLEAGSGVAGLVKTALALKHRQIPPHLHFETPNSDIDFSALNLRVPLTLEAWPANGEKPRIAGINSFGFGGANAHAILAEAPTLRKERIVHDELRTHVIPLSAKSSAALQQLAQAWRTRLATDPEWQNAPLSDLAGSAMLCRSHHSHRVAFVATSKADLASKMEAYAGGAEASGSVTHGTSHGEAPQLAFVYTGMGPQWWAMGRQLLAEEPVFRATLEECERLWRQHASWSLMAALTANENDSRIEEAEVAQPCLFAIQIGLTALWQSWGITPDAVVGHSLGEIAAACAAQALSLEEAVRVIFHRSRLQHQLRGRGRMLAVGLSLEEAARLLHGCHDRVDIAAINSPRSVTLSGDAELLEQMRISLVKQQTFAKFLRTEVPYHSAAMDCVENSFLESLQDLRAQSPVVALYSTVTGYAINGELLDAEYWWRNIRHPVRFSRTVRELLQCGYRAFLEIGPHPVLANSIRECADADGISVEILESLNRAKPERTTMLNALGTFYCRRRTVNWRNVLGVKHRRMKLPLNPWQREQYWRETKESQGLRRSPSRAEIPGFRGPQVHPLLGRAVDVPAPDFAWGTAYDLTHDHAWLAQHRVQNSIICPAAASLETALAAARQWLGPEPVELSQVEMPKALHLSLEDSKHFMLRIDGSEQEFRMYHRDTAGEWSAHVGGCLAKCDAGISVATMDLDGILQQCPRVIEADDWYELFGRMGLGFGPWFQSVQRVHCGPGEALAEIEVPANLLSTLEDYLIHPAILDCCIQVVRGAMPEDAPPQLYMPRRLARIRLHQPLTVTEREHQYVYSHVRLVSFTAAAVTVDIRIYDVEQQLLAEIDGLTYQAINGAESAADAQTTECYYEHRWTLAPRGNVFAANAWPQLPSPTQLRERVCNSLPSALVQKAHRERQYAQLEPSLQRLAAAYVLAALRDLGVELVPQQIINLENLSLEAGVCPQFNVWFAELLSILQMSGLVRGTSKGLQVQSSLADFDTDAAWKSALDRVPGFFPELWLFRRCGTNLARILRGEVQPSELIFQKNGLDVFEHLAQDGGRIRPYHRLAREVLLAVLDKLPEEHCLQILETAGANGGLTSHLLPDVPPGRAEYFFTDADESSFDLVRQKFDGHTSLRCKILDIEADPTAQGFGESGFDLVFHSGWRNPCVDMHRVVGNIKRLLRPGGLLVWLGGDRRDIWKIVVFGGLEAAKKASWDAPSIARQASWPEYAKPFEAAGFQQLELIADVDSHSVAWEKMILATIPMHNAGVPEEIPFAGPRERWLILSDRGGVGEALADQLRARGHESILAFAAGRYEARECGAFYVRPHEQEDYRRILDRSLEQGGLRGIIHLWSVDIPSTPEWTPEVLEEAQTYGCLSAVQLLQSCAALVLREPINVWFVTSGTQGIGDPSGPTQVAQAPLWGFCRVAANELPQCRCRVLDLSESPGPEEIGSLVDELEILSDDDETALRGSARFVNRLVPAALHDLKRPGKQHVSMTPSAFRVEAHSPGALENLEIVPFARRTPEPGEVAIAIDAAGVNFKDVMLAMGLLSQDEQPGLGSGPTLGMECAGRIAAIGKGVQGYQLGDEVIAYAQRTLGSHAIASARLVAPKPAWLTMEEAATIPAVYLTAYYSLHTLANLKAGERILIHAGAGGVGLAAIRLAQLAGAEVFATAGSNDKRDFLRALGVPHVFDSRTLNFSRQILDVTRGEGVDVVLNSLAGEAIPKSLAVLRPYGRFVEMGKRDIVSNSKMALRPFARCLSYFAVDLFNMCLYRQDLAQSIYAEVMRLVNDEAVCPLPHRTFPIGRVVEAFQYVSKSRHLGKVILSTREADRRCVPVEHPPIAFRPDGTYLITGGLGQFGLATAEWLVAHGARHLVLVGRTRPNTEAERILSGLEAKGACVCVLQADVASAEQTKAMLDRVRASLPPLRGLFHAAMVLDDCALLNQTRERFVRVLAPKMSGSWNLHVQTSQDPLEHFVLFSSIATTVGNPGQGSYAAANYFLDALAKHRRAMGLPALSVNWPLVANTTAAESVSQLADFGLKAFSTQTLLETLGHLLSFGAVNPSVGKVDWTKWFRRRTTGVSRRFALVMQTPETEVDDANGGADEIASLEQLLSGPSTEDGAKFIAARLRQLVGRVLGMAPDRIDSKQPLSQLGLDSLMSFDLSSRIKMDLRVDVPGMRLLSRVTVEDLASEILVRLKTEGDLQHRPAGDGATPAKSEAAEKSIDWQHEAMLHAAVAPVTRQGFATPCQTILLTGATGFLGSFLLRDLLTTTEARVISLVRCANEDEGKRRIQASLEEYLLWNESFTSRIEVVRGDLAQPNLALSKEARRKLEDQVDLVLHNGASLDLLLHYPFFKQTNVAATHELLKLACHGRPKSFHYISSLAVLDAHRHHGRTHVTEEDLPCDLDRLDYGYSQSKAVAEFMVRSAMERGLPAFVYRPGLIGADSETGASTTKDIIAQFVNSWLTLQAIPDISQRLVVTPVDYVSRAIVALLGSNDEPGSTYHLVTEQTMSLREFRELMLAMGLSVASMPFEAWRVRLTDLVERDSNNPITRLVPFLIDKTMDSNELPLWPPREMTYGCERTLKRLPFRCPPITAETLRRYLYSVVEGRHSRAAGAAASNAGC